MKRSALAGGAYRVAVEQGTVGGGNSTPGGSRRLREVGELEEHQGASAHPMATWWRMGSDGAVGRQSLSGGGNGGEEVVFCSLLREEEKENGGLAPWSSYSGEDREGLEATTGSSGIGWRQDCTACQQREQRLPG
jgi:hypothetical protein